MSSERAAEILGVHPVVLRRVLGRLRREGIVEGRSGPGGGWAIAHDPAELRLGRVYRALADRSETDGSRLAGALAGAADAYARELDRTTIADLMGDGSRGDSTAAVTNRVEGRAP